MRRLEAIDLSRPAVLLRLPQPGRSCRPDIAVAVLTTIDPLAGTEGSNPTPSSSESAANPTSVSLRDWAIVTPRCPSKPLLIGIYIFRKQARVAVGP